MKKKKISLHNLKVQSFITEHNKEKMKTINAGAGKTEGCQGPPQRVKDDNILAPALPGEHHTYYHVIYDLYPDTRVVVIKRNNVCIP